MVSLRRAGTLSTFGAQALECLYRYRLLSTSQLSRLLTPVAGSTRYARAQLADLADVGLVSSVRVAGNRAQQKAWFVTESGAELTESLPTVERRQYRMTHLRAAGPTQAHTLAVNEVGVLFVEAARARADDCGILGWTLEVAHRYMDASRGLPTAPLIADAVVHYTRTAPSSNDEPQQAFVELDRATMSVHRLATKVEHYVSYYHYRPTTARNRGADGLGRRAWRQRYLRFPAVLLVLTGQPEDTLDRRIRRLRAQCQRDIRLTAMSEHVAASATTLTRLRRLGPFAPIATPLLTFNPTPIALLPTGASVDLGQT